MTKGEREEEEEEELQALPCPTRLLQLVMVEVNAQNKTVVTKMTNPQSTKLNVLVIYTLLYGCLKKKKIRRTSLIQTWIIIPHHDRQTNTGGRE